MKHCTKCPILNKSDIKTILTQLIYLRHMHLESHPSFAYLYFRFLFSPWRCRLLVTLYTNIDQFHQNTKYDLRVTIFMNLFYFYLFIFFMRGWRVVTPVELFSQLCNLYLQPPQIALLGESTVTLDDKKNQPYKIRRGIYILSFILTSSHIPKAFLL